MLEIPMPSQPDPTSTGDQVAAAIFNEEIHLYVKTKATLK